MFLSLLAVMIGPTEQVFTEVSSTSFGVWWNTVENFTGDYLITAQYAGGSFSMNVPYNGIPYAMFTNVPSSTVFNVFVQTGGVAPNATGSVRTGETAPQTIFFILQNKRKCSVHGRKK